MKLRLFYITAGMGHKVAAEVIADVVRQTGMECESIDLLGFANPLVRWMYSRFYEIMESHSHVACRLFYRLASLIGSNRKVFSPMIRGIVYTMRRPMKVIRDCDPDLAVCTHFLPILMLSFMKKKGRFHGKVVAVITDYTLHSLWVDEVVDLYIAPNRTVADALVESGISDSRVVASGIPVAPQFSEVVGKDKRLLRKELSIPQDDFVVLFVASGLPTRRSLKIVSTIMQIDFPMTFVVVAGRGNSMDRHLEKVKASNCVNLVKHGFVSDIHRLLRAADLIVTKPGGLTVSESLAVGLPLVMIYPVPEQEEENMRYVVSEGAGVYVEDLNEIPVIIRRFREDPELYESYATNATRIGKPFAVFEIVNNLLEM